MWKDVIKLIKDKIKLGKEKINNHKERRKQTWKVAKLYSTNEEYLCHILVQLALWEEVTAAVCKIINQ
jgi:adenosyl cobinamide kinase/adenosyl cobinamide phosphate guanylyltransferase